MKKFLDKHFWTKEEITLLLKLWDSKSIAEIADELDLRPDQVNYMAMQVRMAGYQLTKKRRVGVQRAMILEVIKEIKHKTN